MYLFPLTMYPSTYPSGALGWMMDQGSFAEKYGPNHVIYDRMAIWRKDSPTIIYGWYQAFVTTTDKSGQHECIYDHQTSLAADRMEYRLSYGTQLKTWMATTAAGTFPFQATGAPGAEVDIRVEMRALGSTGNAYAWTDFEIRDPLGALIPMNDFQTGASQYTEDFYQCTANYWIAETLNECVP